VKIYKTRKLRFSYDVWNRPIGGWFCNYRERNGRLIAGYWEGCKETFQSNHPFTKNILFCCTEPQMKKVVRVVSKIEQKLRISPRTKIGRTNKKNVIWVKISPWWNNTFRKSLFLSILRDARYASSLIRLGQRGQYINSTRPAFELFLAGHTNFRPKAEVYYDWYGNKCSDFERATPFEGWFYIFSGLKRNKARELLIK
jgi:hypothetical protein